MFDSESTFVLSLLVNAVGLGNVDHALCTVKGRARGIFAAGRQHEAAALRHRVDLVGALLVPFLIGADDRIRRGDAADQGDLVAVLGLDVGKGLAVVRRVQEGDRRRLASIWTSK